MTTGTPKSSKLFSSEATDLFLTGPPSIIAVTGLAGHALGSFRSSKSTAVWLRDWLPKDIPEARIFTYGYDKKLIDSTMKASIQDYAKSLSSDIALIRQDEARHRPLIFLAHSLGDLVVKEMLALATDERVRWEMNPHRQCPLSLDLFLSTSALVFFGVPNRGLRHEQLCPAVKGQPNESLVNEIQVDRESDPSPYLKLLGQRFKNCFEQHKPSVEVVAYYELHETPTLQERDSRWDRSGPSQILVTETSACDITTGNHLDHVFPINTDHSGLVKFPFGFDTEYQKVSQKLQALVRGASGKLDPRREETHDRNEKLVRHRIPFNLEDAPDADMFVGRSLESAALDAHFLPKSQHRKTFVLHGIGGVGKTKLARAFAQKHKDDYSAIFWLDGQSEHHLNRSCLNAARRIPEFDLTPETLQSLWRTDLDPDFAVRILINWLSMPENGEWLVIYDNIDNDVRSEESDPLTYDINAYFPTSDQGSVLVTSRLPGFVWGSIPGLRVMPVDSKQAAEILEVYAGKRLSGASALIEKLSSLPLALVLAGTYMREARVGVSVYLKSYNQTMASYSNYSVFSACLKSHRGLFISWITSYNHVNSMDEVVATNLLDLWAFLSPHEIRQALVNDINVDDKWRKIAPALGNKGDRLSGLIRATRSDASFTKTLDLLSRYSLIENRKGTSSIHPILHEWLFATLTSSDKVSSLYLAMGLLAGSAKGGAVGSASSLLPHATHLYQVWERVAGDPSCKSSRRSLEPTAQIYEDTGNLFRNLKMNEAAEKMYQKSIERKEKVHGVNHSITLSGIENLRNFYLSIGRAQDGLNVEAEFLELSVLQFENPYDPELLIKLDELGMVYDALGRVQDAESIFVRAVEGWQMSDLIHKSAHWPSLHLAGLYWKQGSLMQANEMFEISKTILGETRHMNNNETHYNQALRDQNLVVSTTNFRHSVSTFCRAKGKANLRQWLVDRESALGRSAQALHLPFSTFENRWECGMCPRPPDGVLFHATNADSQYGIHEECFAMISPWIITDKIEPLVSPSVIFVAVEVSTGVGGTTSTTAIRGIPPMDSARYRQILGFRLDTNGVLRTSGGWPTIL